MSESEARKYQGASPRINNSDYKARESVGKKRIFSDDDKNAPTCWGCPRWGCLVLFFVLFGALTGITTWLIVKNQMFNTNNPEVKVEYDKTVQGDGQQNKQNSTITTTTTVTTETTTNPTDTNNITNTTITTNSTQVPKHKHYMRHNFEQDIY